MLTQSSTCIGGGTSGTTVSKTAAPSEQKKAKLACNRCRIRKQSCDKKLPHCSRCFKDNVVCTYNWQNKTSETTAVSKKPSKFHFKVFALKTYNDSYFLSLQRSEILNFNSNIKQNTFYHPPGIICNSRVSDLFDAIIRGNDLYFVDLNKNYASSSNPLSPVSQVSSPGNDLVRDLISDTTVWVELLELYFKECFPYNSFFNINTFSTKTVSPLLLNVIYWAGYQYKTDKYPKLTKYLDNLASNSLKQAIRKPSISNVQTLMLGMFVHMYRGEFVKSRAFLAHATRMSTLLGFHENSIYKNLEMIQQRHTVRSQIVIFNTVMRLYCQRPCYFIPDPLGMTVNDPWTHVMGSSIGVNINDFDVVRGHCIYYLTQYFDDIFVDILFHLSECTSKKAPLVDRPRYQHQLDKMFQTMVYRYTTLIQQYPHHSSYIQPFLNYCTFKYYFYSFRLYDYEISTSVHMNRACLQSLSITLENMTKHYTTIPDTLKLIMRNLIQGVGLTMLRVTERVPQDHQKQYLGIVKDIKSACGPDDGLDLLSIGLQQLSIN